MSGADEEERQGNTAFPGGRDGRRATMVLGALALLLLTASGTRADAPLPPPADLEARSPNERCVARADVTAQRVVVSRRAPDGRAVSWALPSWHRALLTGNDCGTLGMGYNGMNLLDLADRGPGTPVMTFFREGGPGRVVRLGDLYPDPAVLPRTVSHLLSRQQDGWDGRRWTVHMVDGRVLEFGP